VNIADPNSVYAAMERQYKRLKENSEQVAKDCRDNIVTNYNIDNIVQTRWIPYLTQLQDELLPILTKKQETTNI